MFYLWLVSFVWAFSFVLIKGVLSGVDSFVVSFLRLSISFLIFLPFLKIKDIRNKTKFKLIICGALQYGVMYVAYISAYKFLPAHIIVLMTVFTPLWVIFFSDIFERKFIFKFLLIAFVAVLGGFIIKYPDKSLIFNLRGVLLMQVSNIAFALGQVYYCRLIKEMSADYKHYNVFGLLYLGAALFTLPFFIAGGEVSLTSKQLVTLIYLGVVASGLCFFWWNKGAASVNNTVLAVMNNVKIPIGVVAVLIVLGENFDLFRLLVGALCMFAALYLARRYHKV